MSRAVAAGTVVWFDATKGFGFIAPDGEVGEVFVEYSDIDGRGYRTLAEGQRVAFDVDDDGRGPRAARVRRL